MDRPPPIAFTKMEGAGNDFVLLDLLQGGAPPDAALARRLADRRFGIGCDQIMLLLPAWSQGLRYGYRILNADGSRAGQCGNGARCVAAYLVARHGLQSGESLDSPSGPVCVHLGCDGEVELALAEPRFQPDAVPFLTEREQLLYRLDLADAAVEIAALSMGNPHAVLLVDDVRAAPVATLGAAIERHPAFPDRANVGFAQVVDRGHLALRVWERGVGETLACGSGACAAVVALIRLGLLDRQVRVDLPGGCLRVGWPGEGEAAYLGGPARIVFDGDFYP